MCKEYVRIGEVTKHLESDGKATRRAWNDESRFIFLTDLIMNPEMLITGIMVEVCDYIGITAITVPELFHSSPKWIAISLTDGTRFASWFPSQEDLLADDWELLS